MRIQQLACFLLSILFQLQCCNAVFTQMATHQQVASSEVKYEEPAARLGSPLAGRRKFNHLVALQQWSRVTKLGMKCPPPEPCECHCDCPNTAVGKPLKPPPPCPLYPSFPAPATKETTTRKPPPVIGSTPAPKLPCKKGEVKLSDGTCKEIDMEVINALYKLVEYRKAELVRIQLQYNKLYKGFNCTACPGEEAYYETRLRLYEAHVQYRAALQLLLNALGFLHAKEDKGPPVDDDGLGPEFLLGAKKSLRPHCEAWTLNGTKTPSRNVCGVICRSEPTCVGFALDPESQWCVWFDDVELKEDLVGACSKATATTYVKKRQVKVNNNLWTSIEKIHVFDKAIIEALNVLDGSADGSAEQTNQTFLAWWDFKGPNVTTRLNLRDHFNDQFDGYTDTILDTWDIRKQFLELQKGAMELIRMEVKSNPPFEPDPAEQKAEAKKIVLPEGFMAPKEQQPKVLNWADFPNSEDTAWSKIHPDCPMGVPCFCDCKCRGAPPQNFIEPPPGPLMPCPPPPFINPAMLTDVLNR